MCPMLKMLLLLLRLGLLLMLISWPQDRNASVPAIFFSSYLADLLGRRTGITVGMVVLLVGVVLQVVPTVDTGMYIGGRFLVGMGSAHNHVALNWNVERDGNRRDGRVDRCLDLSSVEQINHDLRSAAERVRETP